MGTDDRDRLNIVGTIIKGRYSVERVVGKGGFGIVYAATNVFVNTPRALKFLYLEELRDKEAAVTRFFLEAKIGLTLSHPGIARVFEVDTLEAKEQDGDIPARPETPFAVMELLHGRSLHEVIAEGPLRWAEATRLGARLCDPLSAAHAISVNHRDIKPENVYICDDGTTKLLDFGIAHIKAAMRITHPGLMIGTPRYMSREQVLSSDGIDERADIYSLGGLVYAAITGSAPFGEIRSDYEVLAAIGRGESPIDASKFPADVPASVVALVKKAMSLDRNDRFASAMEFKAAAQKCLAEARTLRATPSDPTFQASVTQTGSGPRVVSWEVGGAGAIGGGAQLAASGTASIEIGAQRQEARTKQGRRFGKRPVRHGSRWIAVGAAIVAIGAVSTVLLVHRARRLSDQIALPVTSTGERPNGPLDARTRSEMPIPSSPPNPIQYPKAPEDSPASAARLNVERPAMGLAPSTPTPRRTRKKHEFKRLKPEVDPAGSKFDADGPANPFGE